MGASTLAHVQKLMDHYPLPPLYKKHLRVTVPSHPRGNVPQVTVPSPPPPPRLRCKGRATRSKTGK